MQYPIDRIVHTTAFVYSTDWNVSTRKYQPDNPPQHLMCRFVLGLGSILISEALFFLLFSTNKIMVNNIRKFKAMVHCTLFIWLFIYLFLKQQVCVAS